MLVSVLKDDTQEIIAISYAIASFISFLSELENMLPKIWNQLKRMRLLIPQIWKGMSQNGSYMRLHMLRFCLSDDFLRCFTLCSFTNGCMFCKAKWCMRNHVGWSTRFPVSCSWWSIEHISVGYLPGNSRNFHMWSSFTQAEDFLDEYIMLLQNSSPRDRLRDLNPSLHVTLEHGYLADSLTNSDYKLRKLKK